MKKNISVALLILGIVSIICSGLGLLYNIATVATAVSGAFEKLIQEHGMPYFYLAFYIMSSICIVFYLLLMVCGIHFVRRKLNLAYLFVAIMLSEIVYFFFIGLVGWHLGAASYSIAGATGVANGGLMVQFFILFPLWGSAMAIWAKRQNERNI